MSSRTHLAIDHDVCGTPLELATGSATVALTLLPSMAADDRGLVHGGFVFGLADYAAMLAVNHPLVVLAAAEVRFLSPVVVGDRLVAKAEAREPGARKNTVDVKVSRAHDTVFTGTFTCVIPARHVLDPKIET